MITYKEFDHEIINEVISLYEVLKWSAYLGDKDKLVEAYKNSLYILGAFSNDKLIGFVRCVGDGEHVVLVQDLLVDPNYQKQGIGTTLFKKVWDKYSSVRMFCVYTDINDKVDNSFYKSFNMKPIKEGNMISYFRIPK